MTSAPTGPATVSAASTPYGRVLVVGSGAYAGCSLYVLTSDQLHALTGAAFACSDNANVIGAAVRHGPLAGAPDRGRAHRGSGGQSHPPRDGDPHRHALASRRSQQVTYAGLPLYRFFLDEVPGETEGVNLFDPVTSPGGTWYLVDPSRGLPAVGQAQLQLETAPVGGTGPDQTVLAATMNDGFSLFPDASFPVYTLSTDSGRACRDTLRRTTATRTPARGSVPCSGHRSSPPCGLRPGRASTSDALGIIVRPDGTHQVTYNDQPLYLFIGDAYIPGLIGTQSINGAGLNTPWGEFNPIP